ncbi:MAG: hypothetical protein JXR52_09925 [Bacteroidales bacterium]|nr:hypothetical protein [Bacteroidales bacterium]MBN2699134.1 hypothetical protein [Bacteroidales bacterium]
MNKINISIIFLFVVLRIMAQPVPNVDENIPYLMTFGGEAETSWGDDDFSQAFFFLIPEDYTQPFFIKVFDPDTGGKIDEIAGDWNTSCVYEVYGGEGVWSEVDARETSPTGNYKSGTLLATKTFAENPRYDNQWYTFGPFNPAQGEYVEMFGGKVFKVICEGISGDDGNMYRYYLSTEAETNRPLEGANAFAYEYSFRMHNDENEVSHIYPYIDDRTITLQILNFDWDMDGSIVVISRARQGDRIDISGEDHWTRDDLKIQEEEKESSFDFQFVKLKSPVVRNNNVVVNVRNQYGETLPFYTIPIGGVPKYQYDPTIVELD